MVRAAWPRCAVAPLLPHARAASGGAGELPLARRRGGGTRARAARGVAAALPVLSRSERLARRRSRLPRAAVRRLHGERRRLPPARAAAALVRHAQHTD